MHSIARKSTRAALGAGCSLAALGLAAGAAHATVTPSKLIESGSVVVSTSTYDRSQGAVAALTAGVTQLSGTDSATVTAVAGNSYPTVWNNDGPDGSFGVTSPIVLEDINADTGALLHTISVPTSEVVTSFSSKSELGLHLNQDADGTHLVFVGYGLAGVGALDVSNSDAVPGQDPTNPVTFAFGANYAHPRTIVSMDPYGNFSYTPTLNYGGNNGRAALLGSNGLYYSVGNANNGNAAAFGSANNGTNPDVTETTGLEAVAPANLATFSSVTPPASSAEVDPLVQYKFGTKLDKPGKDNNYRGITEFNGALYFTKGSGSNGYDTVYTVPSLPASPMIRPRRPAAITRRLPCSSPTPRRCT
jgi:hypothetical protein